MTGLGGDFCVEILNVRGLLFDSCGCGKIPPPASFELTWWNSIIVWN